MLLKSDKYSLTKNKLSRVEIFMTSAFMSIISGDKEVFIYMTLYLIFEYLGCFIYDLLLDTFVKHFK